MFPDFCFLCILQSYATITVNMEAVTMRKPASVNVIEHGLGPTVVCLLYKCLFSLF